MIPQTRLPESIISVPEEPAEAALSAAELSALKGKPSQDHRAALDWVLEHWYLIEARGLSAAEYPSKRAYSLARLAIKNPAFLERQKPVDNQRADDEAMEIDEAAVLEFEKAVKAGKAMMG